MEKIIINKYQQLMKERKEHLGKNSFAQRFNANAARRNIRFAGNVKALIDCMSDAIDNVDDKVEEYFIDTLDIEDDFHDSSQSPSHDDSNE